MTTVQQSNDEEQSAQVAIPSFLIDYLEKKTKRTSSVTQGRYSVTDIVGCQRKNYYRRLGVEEEMLGDKTVENMWDSVRGEFLHQLSYACKWRELDIEHHISLRDASWQIGYV